VTKPGGLVTAREGDLGTECVWPELPGLVKFHDFIVKSISTKGGSSTGGRQLLAWVLKAGAERSQITLSYGTWCYSTSAEKKTWGKFYLQSSRCG
jgi:hypothetical protein